ncbi:hypothetical protein AAG570_002536 [Ranatra chinensis]|uniref:Wiskott-Aldrich syndrome protein family member n=1 Tax=Ranatra chinensis TaxID=642074 RepID=A0ABD0Y884_9HEMI
MPLPKRVVEPVHVARGTIPLEEVSLPSELEAVTNGTLANAVRQLSSLSKHAEDLFAELARDSRGIATRANSLQARIDRLAIKVTQLDSTVEEVSLQDIHMRKAFKSAVVFDQQVVSRDTMPTAMLQTYKHCDKPPPLDKLNPYREDGKDGLKFYTDPDYFFDLWRQEMLKDTERMMHDKGKKPHRPRTEGGGGRHKKRVRQPHNTRERQRQIAVGHGEYIMPQTNHYRTPPIYQATGMIQDHERDDQDILNRPSRPNSIELRRSYPADQNDSIYSPSQQYQHNYNSYVHQNHYGGGLGFDEVMNQYQNQHQSQMQGNIVHYARTPSGRGSRSSSIRPTQPPPAPPTTNTSTTSTPTICSTLTTPTRGRSVSSVRDNLPPPPPPPVDVPPASPPPPPCDPLPPPPPPSPPTAPPPPPPPPPLPSPPLLNGDVKSPSKKVITGSPPKATSPPKQLGDIITPQAVSSVGLRPKPPAQQVQYDPRSDLLKAIRDGIKLRKVEKNEQKEGERVNALHDVASILARRVAVEFSDSDSASESEYDSEGWVEPEPSV